MPNGWAKNRVKQMASEIGISVSSLRRYIKVGIFPVSKKRGVIFLHHDNTIARYERLRELKDEGYTLKKIADILQKEFPKKKEEYYDR